MRFPIDLGAFKRVVLHADQPTLSAEQRDQLAHNIQLCRDAIVFFTACRRAKGLGGHTGGAYDTVPEVLITAASSHGWARSSRSSSTRPATASRPST